jgi:hypothetical protein
MYLCNDLCTTFRNLAFSTWNIIQRAKSVSANLGEETITDINLLNLKLNHPKEIITAFNKKAEAKNGADWEWWLTGKSRKWLGIRFQAKIINYVNDKYDSLHYQINTKSTPRPYQSDVLIKSALCSRAIPLYCLYSYWDNPSYKVLWKCGSFPMRIDSFGCSLVNAHEIVKMRKNNHLNDLLPHMIPWHCIICCKAYGGNDLPERAANTIREQLKISNCELLNEPPKYVKYLFENRKELFQNGLESIKDDNLRGIIIIDDNNSQD